MDHAYIETKLVPALDKAPGIEKYQLHITRNQSVKSGFINDQFGGIYRPVINSEVELVEFRVLFTDGRSSIGSAPLQTPPDKLIGQMLASAHHAAKPIVFAPKHNKVDMIALADESIQNLIENTPEEISTLTKELQKHQLALGNELVEGGVRLMASQRRLLSSEGVDMRDTSTRQSIHTYFESRLGVGLAKRSKFGVEAIKTQSLAMSGYSKALTKQPAKLTNGSYTVLLDSGEGWGMLDRFILDNVAGRAVEAGQSHFKTEDFKQSKTIAHPTFSLNYDQRKPMGTESFNFSSQGILSQKFTLIKDGKLTEPICDLKVAKNLGYTARTLDDSTTDGVVQAAYSDFVKSNQTFILVFGLMGLHTLKAALGNYSLPVPDALLIQDGQVVGSVNCVLSGNFFDVLMQPSTSFVDAPHLFDSPALTFETQVTIK